ncbi:MAG TPA: PKD domain-containing protein [Bacteroidales bacterium]|nr:PKD domain-containing protein [Bacteroidales bacterium]
MSTAKIISLLIVAFSCSIPIASSVIPTQHLRLWLRADSGVVHSNGVVEIWQDVSGNGNHARQSNAALRPRITENVMNYKPAITFSNSFLDINSTIGFQTVFIVANYTAGDNFIGFAGLLTRNRILDGNTDLLYVGNTGTSNFWPAPIVANTFINGIRTGSFAPLQQMKIISGNLSARAVWDDFRIGQDRGMSRFWAGHILEILIFDRVFSESERVAIERYLSDKYAPPINLGPDISMADSFCPVVVSTGPGFTNHLWSTGQTSPYIAVTLPGTYSVSARNAFGFFSSDTIRVRLPVVSLNHSTVSICYGDSVSLTLIGMQPGFSYLWSTGANTPTITVRTAGTFALTVTDNLGCSISLSAVVHVDNFARGATLGPDRPFCLGDALSLDGSGAAVEFLWSTGATVPSITVNEPGSYWVRALSAAGCVAVDTVMLTFGGHRPTALFSATGACPGQPVSFTDLSTVASGAVVGWHWDFQDGHTSTERNPVHTPSRPPGTAPVTLQVLTDAGCRHAETLPVQVFHNPEVSFTPNHACSRVPLQFTDTSSDPDLGGITAWQWSFHDGSVSSSQNASFTFPQAGSFPVTLHATSAAGCSASLTRDILVRDSPTINFEWTTACPGEQVHFTEISSAPVWAPITVREWTFGDGYASTRLNPAHTFPSDGVFPVTLSLTASNGCRISLTKEVTVHSLPVVDFAIADLCQGLPHRFVDLSTVERSTIAGWEWSFGNQGSSSLQHPSFSFASPGQYVVRLEAVSAAGCRNSVIHNIMVNPKPRAGFSFYPTMGASPLMVTFTNTSQGAVSYLWNFGDGSPTSTLPAPVHTFRTDGRYNLELIATSPHGCSDTLRKEIRVVPLRIEVSVTHIDYVLQGGFLEVKANLLNLGTRDIDTLILDLHLGGRTLIRERWMGSFRTGNMITHTFHANLPVDNLAQHNYLCVRAQATDWLPEDENPENNRFCIVFSSKFQVFAPRPNPMVNHSELPINLPVEGNVQITIYNISGNPIITFPPTLYPAGLNFIFIPGDLLSSGSYLVRVTYNDQSITHKLMKTQ